MNNKSLYTELYGKSNPHSGCGPDCHRGLFGRNAGKSDIREVLLLKCY